MRPLTPWLAILVAGAMPADLAAQRTTPVSVDALVCDPDGRPVAGATFGDRWEIAGSRWQAILTCNAPDQRAPLRSDAEGRLRGVWVEDPMETPLFGASADRSLVGFVFSDFVATGDDPPSYQPVVRGRITLHRARRLGGVVRTVMDGVAKRAAWLGITVPHPRHPGHGRTVWFGLDAPAFELPLPPGTYRLHARVGLGGTTRTVVLPADRDLVDIGPVSVPAKPFDLVGEVLPDWEIGRAENLPAERAGLPAFRGKPVLIRFDEFGLRGRPLGDARTQLARLAAHPRRGEFHVVLFDTSFPRQPHAAQPPDEPLVERMFPLLAPAGGFDVQDAYGSRFATIVLDRDGRLLHFGTEVPIAITVLEAALPPVRPPARQGRSEAPGEPLRSRRAAPGQR
ncbi:MAG: hypothetical protein IT458_20405 [Planctomycetes bacterium]|nr:hypothetical protein [Planctomycetota bacterium]